MQSHDRVDRHSRMARCTDCCWCWPYHLMTTKPATKPLHGKCRLGWNAGLGSILTRPGDAGTGDAFLLAVN